MKVTTLKTGAVQVMIESGDTIGIPETTCDSALEAAIKVINATPELARPKPKKKRKKYDSIIKELEAL